MASTSLSGAYPWGAKRLQSPPKYAFTKAFWSIGNSVPSRSNNIALIPILIPLLISQFRRAEELATAMECRCYRGGGGRTRMNVLRFSPCDFLAAAAIAALLTGILLLNLYFPALL
jgi:energy-coupling factor transporter transmembrane protein EcfT